MSDSTVGSNQTGFAGQWQPEDSGSDFNKIRFLVKQLINLLSTATLVQIKAVTTADQVGEPGFVDVQPLVNLMDGSWNASNHGIVYHLPFFRLQGGGNAIICDPEVNDLAIAVFADRDISSVVSNKAQANPGSRRRFSMADGMVIGGFLNKTPTQYVRFRSDGLELVDLNGNKIIFSPSGIEITTVGTLTNNGVNVGDTHVHSGVQGGSSNSGPPH